MAKLTGKLTGIVCTPEMQTQVMQLAEQEQRSVSAVIRLAVQNFLDENLRKSTINVDYVDSQAISQ